MRRGEEYTSLATSLGVALWVTLPTSSYAQAPPADTDEEKKSVTDYVSMPIAVICAVVGASIAIGITVLNLCNPLEAFYAKKQAREQEKQQKMMERIEAQKELNAGMAMRSSQV